MTERDERLALILADMRSLSEVVDETVGSTAYSTALVSLALVARHYLRELDKEE